jgi:hypothetical protein
MLRASEVQLTPRGPGEDVTEALAGLAQERSANRRQQVAAPERRDEPLGSVSAMALIHLPSVSGVTPAILTCSPIVVTKSRGTTSGFLRERSAERSYPTVFMNADPEPLMHRTGALS